MTAGSAGRGRLTRDPDLRDAAGAATRALWDRGPRLFLWWWAVLIVTFVAGAIGREVFGAVESSTWQWAATAPKVLMLILGGLLAATYLPQYVSYGITRRAFLLAAGVLTVVASLAGAVIFAGGYAVEVLLYDAVGWRHALDEPHLFTSAGRWYLVIPEFTVLLIAWTASGWLVGAGYYRWNWWRGTLFVIPAALPLVAVEAFTAWFTHGRVPLSLAVAGIVLAAGAGAFASYHLSKDITLRHSAGWTI